VLGGEGGEGRHVRALTIKMYWHNCCYVAVGIGAYGFRGGLGGEVEGAGIYVCEEGGCADTEDGTGGGEEAEGGGDDRVGGADLEGGEGEPEGVGAAGAAGGEGDFAEGGGGLLELRDFGAEDEALGGADGLDGGHDFIANEGKLAGEIEDRNGLQGLRHRGLSYRERWRRVAAWKCGI